MRLIGTVAAAAALILVATTTRSGPRLQLRRKEPSKCFALGRLTPGPGMAMPRARLLLKIKTRRVHRLRPDDETF